MHTAVQQHEAHLRSWQSCWAACWGPQAASIVAVQVYVGLGLSLGSHLGSSRAHWCTAARGTPEVMAVVLGSMLGPQAATSVAL